ncbi:MAG: SRPBCC family protein [Thermoanaerobaculia bacterium]
MTDRPQTREESDRELFTSRVLAVPRDRVFDAFRDGSRLARWWGPHGFTNTFHEFAFRPGGRWRFTMHGPNGADFENECVFVEVVPQERVVVRHTSTPQFEMTVTLDDAEGGTRVCWRQAFATAEECRRASGIAVDGNEQNLDRLAVEVEASSTVR